METATYQDVWELLEHQLKTEIKLNWQATGPVVLAVDSEKGGVGKSGLAGGLVAVMAHHGYRVLAIDLDPRGTFTAELGAKLTGEEGEYSVNDLLYVDPKIDAAKRPPLKGLAAQALRSAAAEWGPNVQVLAAERALAHRETDATVNLEHRLRVSLEGVADQFDIVVMDLPPRAGGKLVASGLLAATHVVFPGTLDPDGFDGISEARQTYAILNETNGGKLVDVGIVRNIVDRRTSVAEVYDGKFVEAWGDRVLPVAIPRRVIRIESRTACVPITVSNSQGAKDVINGYTAVLNHIGRAA